jgi:hypothetical protein
VSSSAKQAAFLRRKRIPVPVGVDELVALSGREAAHAADCLVDGLTAVWRQLPELLKELARPLLLIGRQVLPGFHAVEHSFLLLRRQAGKMLQPVLQSGLLLLRKPTELRIVFEGAVLLRGWQILIAAEPVAGVAGLVLRRMELIGTAGTTFFLKVVPLPVGMLRLRMLLGPAFVLRISALGEQRRQQQ